MPKTTDGSTELSLTENFSDQIDYLNVSLRQDFCCMCHSALLVPCNITKTALPRVPWWGLGMQGLEGDEGSLGTCRANQEHNSQPFQTCSPKAAVLSHKDGPEQRLAGFFQACSPIPNENDKSRTVVFCLTRPFLSLFPHRVSTCADC